ncbi:MAG TPA: hypothetical protein VNU93_03495, partial [Verrucomicrobiae bacterium]|nr:hypothetical protein [Verrucomicrobiae bacterium]
MDKHLVLLVIMFFALLLKALINAVRDSTWTALKTKKFYFFLSLNLVAPVLLLLIKSLFSVFERDLTKDVFLAPQGFLTPGLV